MCSQSGQSGKCAIGQALIDAFYYLDKQWNISIISMELRQERFWNTHLLDGYHWVCALAVLYNNGNHFWHISPVKVSPNRNIIQVRAVIWNLSSSPVKSSLHSSQSKLTAFLSNGEFKVLNISLIQCLTKNVLIKTWSACIIFYFYFICLPLTVQSFIWKYKRDMISRAVNVYPFTRLTNRW